MLKNGAAQPWAEEGHKALHRAPAQGCHGSWYNGEEPDHCSRIPNYATVAEWLVRSYRNQTLVVSYGFEPCCLHLGLRTLVMIRSWRYISIEC